MDDGKHPSKCKCFNLSILANFMLGLIVLSSITKITRNDINSVMFVTVKFQHILCQHACCSFEYSLQKKGHFKEAWSPQIEQDLSKDVPACGPGPSPANTSITDSRGILDSWSLHSFSSPSVRASFPYAPRPHVRPEQHSRRSDWHGQQYTTASCCGPWQYYRAAGHSAAMGIFTRTNSFSHAIAAPLHAAAAHPRKRNADV